MYQSGTPASSSTSSYYVGKIIKCYNLLNLVSTTKRMLYTNLEVVELVHL
jgi:hypothetical protein